MGKERTEKDQNLIIVLRLQRQYSANRSAVRRGALRHGTRGYVLFRGVRRRSGGERDILQKVPQARRFKRRSRAVGNFEFGRMVGRRVCGL